MNRTETSTILWVFFYSPYSFQRFFLYLFNNNHAYETEEEAISEHVP